MFYLFFQIRHVTVGAGMITNTMLEDHSPQLVARTYTEAEIALNKYIREHYPEWNCETI